MSTPTPAAALNFETTNIANKTNVVFNTPAQAAGVAGPGVNGLVNIPTVSAGLTTLTFNTPNAGNNLVSFVTPAAQRHHDLQRRRRTGTDVRHRRGRRDRHVLTLNGGPATNTLTYDAGDYDAAGRADP